MFPLVLRGSEPENRLDLLKILSLVLRAMELALQIFFRMKAAPVLLILGITLPSVIITVPK